MKKFVLLFALLGSLFLGISCSTTGPVAATSNELGAKVGTSTAGKLFGLIPIPFDGDYSIAKAARNGGITKISTVDLKEFSYLGVWSGKTTIVTGE